MSKKRIVVTGMGVISPIGNDLDTFWQASKAGQSGVKSIDLFTIPPNLSQVAGMVQNYYPESALITNNYHGEDRTVLFAFDAINQALTQAKIDLDNSKLNVSCSLVLSSAVGAIISMERHFIRASTNGQNKISQSTLYPEKSYHKFNYISDVVANHFNINGRSLLMPTGCAGSLDAITYSMSLISNGISDIVITGASEAPITPLVVAAFGRIGATSTKYNDTPSQASRPFDKNRDGFVLAEGCGILILESLDHARDRDAKIYAEISGFGSVNNCFHMTNIPENGISIARACQAALSDAGIGIGEIDHINTHGSSTPQNDLAETNAFKHVFGSRYKNIPVTSNKSFLGHALGASNALETILAIQTINHGIVPPTINLFNPDEKCDLDIVGNTSRSQEINTVLKSSSGFSGIHTSLVIEKFKETTYV